MKKIFLVTNELKDPSFELAKRLKDFLEKRGVSCTYEGLNSFRKDADSRLPSGRMIPADTELFIVLGGDGTIMEAAGLIPDMNIPVFGIKTGTLGYLTEADENGASAALEQILSGSYILEKRMLLDGCVCKNEASHRHTAVNDIVIARYGPINTIDFEVIVDSVPLCSYRADGMVLSTPTGSTAYNMSLGGPIADPTADIILMTPIAPHTLASRSIVLSGESRVELKFINRRDGRPKMAEVSFDSIHTYRLEPGESVTATRSEKYLTMLRLKKTGFMDTLQKKLVQ